jgi:hypothetical protein
MKSRIIYCLLSISIFSSCYLFQDEDNNREGYRDGSESGTLINEGSLIGSWEETYKWSHGDEHPSSWYPANIRYSDHYVFLEGGTFTSTNTISECLGSAGTYTLEGTKIKLKYICQTDPEITKEVVIDEFFFREKHIVFIKGEDYHNISKFELVKEN